MCNFPTSFKKGAAFCKIPLSQLLYSCLIIREHSTSLLQSAKIAPSRTLGLPTYERAAFIPPPQTSNLSLICSSPFYAASKKDSETFLFLKSFFGFIMVWLTVRLPGQECSCLPLPLTFWPDPGMSCASFQSHSYPGRTGSENSFRNPERWFP